MSSRPPPLQRRRREARQVIRAATLGPLMRGSIVDVRRRCGRSNCACATDPRARHPGKYLSVNLEGKTQTLHLRTDDEAWVRGALDAYARLWNAINELTACELAELRSAARQRRLEARKAAP